MEKRLILYQIWVVSWTKQAFSEGSTMFKSKAQHFETLEVTCPGCSEVSLWIEAEEEDLISLLDDVIHSQIDSFFYYFETGHGVFQLLLFPLAFQWMKLWPGLRTAVSWFPSITCILYHQRKNKSTLRTPFENFKRQSIYLKWWKPFCQAKLQLCFNLFHYVHCTC